MDKKKQLKKILDKYPMLEKDRNFIISNCANKTIIDVTLLHTRKAEYITVTDEQINDICNYNAIFYVNSTTSSSSSIKIIRFFSNYISVNTYDADYDIKDNKLRFNLTA